MSRQETDVSNVCRISFTINIFNKLLISFTDSAGNMKLADFGALNMGQSTEDGAGWKATEIIKDPSKKPSPSSDIQVCHQIIHLSTGDKCYLMW